MSQSQTLTIDQALALALDHHRAGRLADAEAIYRQVLAAHPDHAGALNLLGALAYQVGRHDVACELIGRALALHPDFAEAHNNLGATLRAAGDLARAETRRALALTPLYHEARLNLGILLWQSGQPAAAAEQYRAILEQVPDHADALNNLGNALYDLGQPDAAGDSFCRALAIKPDYVRRAQQSRQRAVRSGRAGRSTSALRAGDRRRAGLRRLPHELRQRVARPRPLAGGDRALRPGAGAASRLDDARWNQALALLLGGDYDQGWEAYRTRWLTRALRAQQRDFSQPAWDGADPTGRTILIHAEQGMGDRHPILPLPAARQGRAAPGPCC